MLPTPDYKVQSNSDGRRPDGTRQPAKTPDPSEGPSLFDNGQHAASARADAAIAALPKQTARQAEAIRQLRVAGTVGHTRESLANAMGLRIQSICSVALALLRNGDAIEVGKRKTSSGSLAAVMVAKEFAGADR